MACWRRGCGSHRLGTLTSSSHTEERVLVDPSILLQAAALDALSEAADLLVASVTFAQALEERTVQRGSPLLPPGQERITDGDRERALGFLGSGVDLVSYRDADLDPALREIRDRLLESGDLADLVDADQWAYLASHSVMFSRVRRPLDAFRSAGAVLVEYGRRVLDEALGLVIPKDHFERYDPHELYARGVVKWLIVGGGGAAAGFFGGPAGAVAGSGIPGVLVRAADP
jgi:hypothetical protein